MSKYFAVIVLFFLLFSCGDKTGYTTPQISAGDIKRSACRSTPGEEELSYHVDGGTLYFSHKNLFLPENTAVGIVDLADVSSLDVSRSVFYLDADEETINITESFRFAGEKNCYFDFTVIVTNISGGIYDLYIWDYENEQISVWEDIGID